MQEQWLGIKSCALFFCFNWEEKGFRNAGFFCPPSWRCRAHTHTHRMDVHTLAHSKADTQTTRYNTVQSKNIILKHLFFFLPHGSLKVAILSELLTPVCLHEAKRWAQTRPGRISTFLYLLSPSPDQQKSGRTRRWRHVGGWGWGWKTHRSVASSGVRGWEWGRRKGHRGLLSRPGCICSHGHWVGGTGGGGARTLKAKRPKRRSATGSHFLLNPLGVVVFFVFLHFSPQSVCWTNSPSEDIRSSNRSPLMISVEKRWRREVICYFIYNRTTEDKQRRAGSQGASPFVGSNMSESSFGKSNTGRKTTASTSILVLTVHLNLV